MDENKFVTYNQLWLMIIIYIALTVGFDIWDAQTAHDMKSCEVMEEYLKDDPSNMNIHQHVTAHYVSECLLR